MNILSEDGLRTLISTIKTFVKEKIPTKTSQLTNDSNYITDANLASYAKTSEVDTKLSTKADKNVTKIITIPTTGWGKRWKGLYALPVYMTDYGLKETDDVVIDILIGMDIDEIDTITPERAKICQNEWAKIVQAYTGNGYIYFCATSLPTIPLTVQVRKL